MLEQLVGRLSLRRRSAKKLLVQDSVGGNVGTGGKVLRIGVVMSGTGRTTEDLVVMSERSGVWRLVGSTVDVRR
jgi:hypothetical protein